LGGGLEIGGKIENRGERERRERDPGIKSGEELEIIEERK